MEHLAQSPTLRVNKMSKLLGVTTETIRRDLEELAEQGAINRTYGGAVLHRSDEPAVSTRHQEFVDERISIARAAVELLGSAKVIMIGSGATTTQVAKRIAAQTDNVTVVAHSFSVASALAVNPTIKVIMAPGAFHAGEGAMHGAQTIRFLGELVADWSVTGASAVAPEGPYDALIEAADIYATMLRQSSRHMVVADHSKFDRIATARYSDWNGIDDVVTDKRPSEALASAFSRAKVNVTLAAN